MVNIVAITREKSLKHFFTVRFKEEVNLRMNEMKVTFKSPDEILEFVNTVSKYEFDMDMRRGRAVV